MLHVWVRSRGYCDGLECSVWHHRCFNGFDVSISGLRSLNTMKCRCIVARIVCQKRQIQCSTGPTSERTHRLFHNSNTADRQISDSRDNGILWRALKVSAPSWDRVGMDTQKGRIARIWGTHGHHKWSRNKTWPCEQRVPQGLVMQIGCDRDNIHSREWFLNRYKNILAKVLASKKQNWYIKGNLWKSPFLVGTWRIISLAKWLPWFINLTGTSIPYPPKRKSPSGNLT